MKVAPHPSVRLEIQRPIHEFGKASAHGQANAGALDPSGFGAESIKWHEQPISDFDRDAGAIVFHRNREAPDPRWTRRA